MIAIYPTHPLTYALVVAYTPIRNKSKINCHQSFVSHMHVCVCACVCARAFVCVCESVEDSGNR